RIVDRLHAGAEFVRPVHIGAIESEIADAVALVKKDVEKWRQRRVYALVEPNLDWAKIRRVVIALDLLRRPQRDIGPAAVGAPPFLAGAGSEVRIGVRDPLIDFVFIGVRGRAWIRISDVPEVLDEVIARI